MFAGFMANIGEVRAAGLARVVNGVWGGAGAGYPGRGTVPDGSAAIGGASAGYPGRKRWRGQAPGARSG